MQTRDSLDLTRCRWEAQIHRIDGSVEHQHGLNIFTTKGKEHIANRTIEGSPAARMSHIAVGSGTATPLQSDLTLGTEITASRTALTTQSASARDVTVGATVTNGTGGNWLVTEVGLFNQASGGDVFARFLVQTVTLIPTESITFTWTLDVGGP